MKAKVLSPYRVIYESMSRLIKLEIEDKQPPLVIGYQLCQLQVLQGFEWVEEALVRGVLKQETVEEVQSFMKLPYRQLVPHFEEIWSYFHYEGLVSLNGSQIGYLTPETVRFALVDEEVLLFFLVFVNCKLGGKVRFDLEDMPLGVRLNRALYYFSLFGYMEINLSRSDQDTERLNTELFLETSLVKGYFQTNLIEQGVKEQALTSQGLEVGTWVFLYERNFYGGLAMRNEGAKPLIQSVNLAEVVEVSVRGVKFKTVSIKRSLVQLLIDFAVLPPEVREVYGSFVDYLPEPQVHEVFVVWSNLGIGEVQNNNIGLYEHYFVTSLSSIHRVPLPFFDDLSLDGFGEEWWTTEEVVYYLLKTYQVPFDEKRYLERYPLENPKLLREQVAFDLLGVEDALGLEGLDKLVSYESKWKEVE